MVQAVLTASGAAGTLGAAIRWIKSDLTTSTVVPYSVGNTVTGTVGNTLSRITASAPSDAAYCSAAVQANNHSAGTFTADDFALTQFPNTQDELPDGVTRKAVTAIDGNGRALIDFTQAHTGKVIDNLGDGTYARTLATRVNAGRPTVDFSEAIHSNKTLDYIGDGSTYSRVKSARLQNGIPVLPSYGRNLAPNELMANNTVGAPVNTSLSSDAPACDGWKVYNVSGGAQLQYSTDAGFNSATSLKVALGNGAVIPVG